MLKTLAFSLVVTSAIGGTVVAAQAREYSVWGYNFTTDDVAAPATAPTSARPQNFNALAAPGRHHMRIERLDQFEQR